MLRGMGKAGCRKAQGMLSEYIDETLNENDRVFVEQHLNICNVCSNEYESLRATVDILHRIPVAKAPRSFAIREKDVEPKRASIFEPERWGWLRPATAVAAIALVVVLSIDIVGIGSGVVSVDDATEQLAMSTTQEEDVDVSGVRGMLLPEATMIPSPLPGVVVEEEMNDGFKAPEATFDGEWIFEAPPISNDTGIITAGGGMVGGANDTSAQVFVDGNLTSGTNATAIWDYDEKDQVERGNATEVDTLPEGNVTDIGNTTVMIAGSEKSAADSVSIDDASYIGEETSLISDDGGGWPLRQIEIAMGVVLFVLVGALVFTRLRRRSLAGI